ncbi:META domain-containing protein [Ferrimonas gelatinilytica]|uniref:META domain-containing protein n=1 Tax=Ferrimonas gelatinilytica TaxID=1255257 RepID=A0ABP9SEC5_9GAMM
MATVALGLTGCSLTGESAPSPYEGQWIVSSVNGETFIGPPTTPYLTIESGQLSADLGCNRFSGSWPEPGEPFGPVISTRKGCPEPLASAEQALTSALASANGYRIHYDRLQILAGERVVLEGYRAAPLSQWLPLSGEYSLTYLKGVERIHDLFGGRPPYLELTLDRAKAEGNSGCNQYFAEPVAAGQALSLTPAGMTLMACQPALMEQEQALMRHFAEANRTLLEGERLQWWRDETLLLEFVRSGEE